MALRDTARQHAIEVGDRVYFENDKNDTGTVVEVWYGQPRDYPGGYHDRWRALVQWDRNSRTGEEPGELSENGQFALRPCK